MDASQLEADRRRRVFFALFFALLLGLSFFAIGYLVLGARHPEGDAYILFRYAENVAAGHGFVFNIGGPRSEGATDFLWLVLLVGALRLGGDVAFSALALNALGAALAGWLLARLCWGEAGRPNWVRAALSTALASVVLLGGAQAGYGGFSAMLYSALILLMFAISLEARGPALLAIPVLGLVVALFRPDGVMVGVSFVLLGLWPAWSGRRLGAYLAAAALCGLAGLLYFAWRWDYFGLLLPLPLYVKQYGTLDGGASGWMAKLPGLVSHRKWLLDDTGPLLIAMALAALLVYARFWRDEAMRRLVVFQIPVAALLAQLAFAVQTQNYQFRFQAPVYLVLLYSLLYVAGRLLDRHGARAVRLFLVALVVGVVAPASWSGLSDVRWVMKGGWGTYLEAFAPRFGPRLDAGTRVALTETGILPYWSRAQVADIVGLTNPDTARRPATVRYLRDLDPDLVFFHHAGSLDNATLKALAEDGARVVPISSEKLRESLRPAHRRYLEEEPQTYAETGLQTVQYAAVALTRFLSESADYDILAVDFKGNRRYVHIYGLKKGWALRDAFMADLRAALAPDGYLSYRDARDSGISSGRH